MNYTYYKIKCQKCGRKILVEVLLFGVNHNADLIATCAECLQKKGLDKKFAKKNPEVAKDIKAWLT